MDSPPFLADTGTGTGKEKALDFSVQIQNLLEQNKFKDLQRFLKRRDCLNTCNMALIYFFHIVQSAGILTTTIAASTDQKDLIWVGVGLNLVASLITVFERTNNSISKGLLKDIEAIKNGTFVDEGEIVSHAKEPLLSNSSPSSSSN